MEKRVGDQPMQPFIEDSKTGTVRFQRNLIVDTLLEYASQGKRLDLNDLACMNFSQEDRCQFAQLIGYSLRGYHELSYVSDEHAKAATKAARKQLAKPDIAECRDQKCPIHCGVERE